MNPNELAAELDQSWIANLLNSIDSSLKVIAAVKVHELKGDMESFRRLDKLIQVFDGLLSPEENWKQSQPK